MTNKDSVINLHYGQEVVSHIDLKAGKALKSLWIEIPEYCHLYCDYCFASTNSKSHRDYLSIKLSPKYLNWEGYEKCLKEFAKLGGKFIGIPGKGEPFHPNNVELTKKIILLAKDLKLKTTIFTTGETIFFKPVYSGKNILSLDNIPDFELMNFLLDKDIILLIKFNSENEEIQDEIVHTKNYTKLRSRAIELLVKNGFNTKNKPKLGIVTSIIKENYNEIIDLYNKYHLEKDFIFDCDTILERGRGRVYTKDKKVPPKVDLEKVFKQLKRAGAINSCQGGTYVGSTCDRVLHHLYVSVEGDVYPCIGCLREDLKNNLVLGNLKTKTLSELWNKELRQKLLFNHKQCFTGTCNLCQNFQDEKCYSCLGRCATKIVDKNNLLIDTDGCVNHKPVTTTWIVKVTDYIRDIRSYPRTRLTLENDGLENLWTPNNNISYSLLQKDTYTREIWIEDLLKQDVDPQKVKLKYHNEITDSHIANFSRKKHYKLNEISFPTNKAWYFIKEPNEILEGIDYSEGEKETVTNKIVDIISRSFLSNIFLPSFKILFDKYDSDNEIVRFCNFMLYDNIHHSYFYRSISSIQQNNSNEDTDIQQLIISNWYEDFKDGRNVWKEQCVDLSDAFSEEIYSDYQLILNRQSKIDDNDVCFDFSDLISIKEVIQQSDKFKHFVSRKNQGFNRLYDQVTDDINSTIFNQFEGEEKILKLYEAVNKQTFFALDDIENQDLINKIGYEVKNLANDSNQGKIEKEYLELVNKGKGSMFLNYLVFLRIMHDVYNTNHYYLIYSTNFRDKKEEARNELSGILKPGGLMLCTTNPLTIYFKSELKLFISNILSPFDEFYFSNNIKKIERERAEEKSQRLVLEKFNKEIIEAHSHTIFNSIPLLDVSNIRNQLSPLFEYFNDHQCEEYRYIIGIDNQLKLLHSQLIELNFVTHAALESPRSRKEKLFEQQELKNLISILKELYRSRCNPNIIGLEKIDYNPVFKDKDCRDAFTVLWNAWNNAIKYSKDKSFKIEFIETPTKLNIVFTNEHQSQLNNENIEMLNSKFEPKIFSAGIPIIKHLCNQLKWETHAENVNNNFSLTLKIYKDGKLF